MADERQLSEDCEFGVSLEDSWVCGINDDSMQCCLLGEVKLVFKKALEFAQAKETAAKNVTDIQQANRGPQGSSHVQRKGGTVFKGSGVLQV